MCVSLVHKQPAAYIANRPLNVATYVWLTNITETIYVLCIIIIIIINLDRIAASTVAKEALIGEHNLKPLLADHKESIDW